MFFKKQNLGKYFEKITAVFIRKLLEKEKQIKEIKNKQTKKGILQEFKPCVVEIKTDRR